MAANKTSFRKGDPRAGGKGRIKGQPNKVTEEVRDLATNLLQKAEYRKNLQARLDSGKCHPTIESMLWYYAYGKPKDTLQVETPDAMQLRVVIEK